MNALSTLSGALLVLGVVTFGVGALTRSYMNRQIRAQIPSRPIWASTERGYWRLVKKGCAPSWPLFVTVACLPLGVVMVFAGVLFTGPWPSH